MDIARLSDIKPRTVWEITDDAFDMYREHFALLASISAVVFAPTGILWIAFGAPAWEKLLNSADGPTTFNSSMIGLAWTLPLIFIGYMLHFGATAIAVRDILSGQTTTLASVYKRTFARSAPLLGASLMIATLGFISLCIWIGPALVAAYYCFTPHGILLENRKLMDSIKRSRDMAKAYFGKSFGLFMLMGLVTALLMLGFQGVIELGFFLFPQSEGAAGVFELQKTKEMVGAIADSVITLLVTPLPAIATTLLYYDLRVRREGLDVEFEAEQWGVPLAPDPFGGVLNPKVPKQQKGRFQ